MKAAALALALAFVAAALAAGPAAAQPKPAEASPPPSQAGGGAAPAPHVALFFFFRMQYFHNAVAGEHCLSVFPERTRALDARYEVLRRRVAALAGAAAVEQGSDMGPPAGMPPGDCRMGGLLSGYEDKVVGLEHYLDGAAR